LTTRAEQIPQQIIRRIESHNPGTVFVAADFFDLGEKEAVRKAIARLCKSGVLIKFMRGLYLKPEYSAVLEKTLAARPEEVAQALARNYNWTISPYGETALNQLGLSTQVPAVYRYVSNGPYKEYEYDNFKLRFDHRVNRETTTLSPKTRLVIHALKALGSDRVDDAVIGQLSIALSADEKLKLVEETQYATAWINDVALRVQDKIDD